MRRTSLPQSFPYNIAATMVTLGLDERLEAFSSPKIITLTGSASMGPFLVHGKYHEHTTPSWVLLTQPTPSSLAPFNLHEGRGRAPGGIRSVSQ
jgi:hypothetical protein